MLNFRKLKRDYSPAMLKEGQDLYDQGLVLSAKIVHINSESVRVGCQVQGNFENKYECEIEIDRNESMTIDSDCDCTYKYDCQHLAAVLFYLENHLNEIIVAYSKEADLDATKKVDKKEKATLLKTFKEAENKEEKRLDESHQKELVEEFIGASALLGQSPFFLPEEELDEDKAELAVIFSKELPTEIQLALRLPYRSKPLNILNIKQFLDAIRYRDTLYLGNKRYYFTLKSFDQKSEQILKLILDSTHVPECKEDQNPRTAIIETEAFGAILAKAYSLAIAETPGTIQIREQESEQQPIPCLYSGSLEEPLRCSKSPAILRFELEYLEAPAPKILINPKIVLDSDTICTLEEVQLFECANPGLLYQTTYYRFHELIRRRHLRHLTEVRNITIPKPLFGTFVENSLSELTRFAEVVNLEAIEQFVTLPYVDQLQAECEIHYLNGELEASLHFVYGNINVPAATSQLTTEQISSFCTKQGILARNLTEEQQIIEDLFQDFIFDEATGVYQVKTEKKIVEFMTEVIPRNQHRVHFKCPENLLDQFIYDDTKFILKLKESSQIDVYEVDLKVDGYLEGVTIDQLWECLASKKSFIELSSKKVPKKKGASSGNQPTRLHKILVLDLDKLAPVVQIFDEIGVDHLSTHKEERPLWSLASIHEEQFDELPIEFSMSKKLKKIQDQMLGLEPVKTSEVPAAVNAELRGYQLEGTQWLERLRQMHLSGVLADDMGLGKTLQAIVAITQNINNNPKAVSIVVCPTSLVYNWKEEFHKFNPKIKALAIDGTPSQRKKLIESLKKYNVVITSYSLMQKDIESYQKIGFSYAILDEAQHIKNRGTRNAKSVKLLKAAHRLILSGTPIENSLDELWSLFDFLMPGLLSGYDRFVEKYIRPQAQGNMQPLDTLRRKLSPFIMRRMKKDVLSELPPVSDIVYHCHLSEKQRELYRSYAASAREELSQLVKKEGFDKVQIHVLATLTRLKQICCHPAIFAKETVEPGDSAKYDMLMELLQSLIESNHKTVIFSQYTRMLNIMRRDLEQQGVRFEYLDGSSKNRLSIVKNFNEDPNIPIFLVSLKAGGSGLNLTGADTVIHYDMWWNPAVENQATDRVHRIGQTNSVSSYKLVTLGTIEEKILELQNRKRGLVKKIIASDDEAITKLTWEEVLELLQT